MLTRTKVLDLMIAALLILTLVPGPATAGAPVRGPALAAAPTTHAVKSLNRLRDGGAYFTDFSAPAESSVVQDSLTPLATGATTRVSVASDGSQGDDDSWTPSISAGGRYVAFSSGASNLVGGDTNGYGDIFVHDQQTGETSRVSVASDGGQGNAWSGFSSISADGCYVAFRSYASNLVSGDTNGMCDVFVHDRQTGETSRVSVASDGGQGNDHSWYPSISAGGRYVAFESKASSLVGGDTNGARDVFVHDRQTGQTSRVSVASDGGQGNGGSYDPFISADGRYVAFESYASNLVSGDTNDRYDIFVHDRQTEEITRVSVASDGGQGNSDSYDPSISADGRYMAFKSVASNLVGGDTNGKGDIFVHDRQTGETSRVSVASDGGQGNSVSDSPSISADGRYVAFRSFASNLVGGDTNGMHDIFVHDRQTEEITRVSVASDGGQGNSRSHRPFISAGSRYVTFHSEASNLVGGDTNGRYDIFVHDRGDRPGPPTGVIIAGPTTGFTQTGYIFIATVSPVTTTLPITYTWEATGQSPVTNTSGLNDTVTFTWSTIGSQAITVTATNVVNAVTGVHVITISPVHKLFLPLVMRNH